MIYKNKKTFYKIVVLMIVSVFFIGCYTFTGSSLSPEVKTINIKYFPNYAPLQNPNLSQAFTNALQLRFERRTNLVLTNDEDADIIIEGEITNYQEMPINVVSGDRAAQNQLTIGVMIRYQNNVQLDKSFTRSFSANEPFEANQTLFQVQDELVEKIDQRLIDQIFNAIVADW